MTDYRKPHAIERGPDGLCICGMQDSTHAPREAPTSADAVLAHERDHWLAQSDYWQDRATKAEAERDAAYAVLEADGTDLWSITNAIKKELEARSWIMEGRGNYELVVVHTPTSSPRA